MYVFVVAGDKGGIGKSTTANVFAHFLVSQKNKKGAFIDIDPQSNSSKYNLPSYMIRDNLHSKGFKPIPLEGESRASSIADIFGKPRSSETDTDNDDPVDIYPYPSEIVKNLDIFPSHASELAFAKQQTESDIQKNIIDRFFQFIEVLEKSEQYDFVVIDTAPTKDALMMAALKAATHVFFPLVLEPWGLDGFWGMHQLFKSETYTREPDRPLKLAGIIPNQVQINGLHQGYLEDLKETESIEKHLLPAVGKRIVFAKSVAPGSSPKSVFDLNDKDPAKIESLAWCQEAYRRL